MNTSILANHQMANVISPEATYNLPVVGHSTKSPSFVEEAITPTSSAEENHMQLAELKSPLARGDTASTIGVASEEIHDIVEDIALAAATEVTSIAEEDATSQPALNHLINTVAAPISPPEWLTGFLGAKLFDPCPHHPGLRKNETNFFCLSCTPSVGRGMCKHCLPHHANCSNSSVFQVRRYMYQNVVHVEDMNSLYDVSGVQAYCINAKRAVLIAPKPQAVSVSGPPVFANQCRGCKIPLRPDCTYCSLSCKVDCDYGLVQPHTPMSGVSGLDSGITTRVFPGFALAHKRKLNTGGRGGHSHYTNGDLHGSYPCNGTSRCSPSEASTATRTGVKRRKLDFPLRSHWF